MNNQNHPQRFNLKRTIKKLSLSVFVVLTFIAYALHKPSTSNNGSLGLAALTPSGTVPPQADTPTPPANTSEPPSVSATAPVIASATAPANAGPTSTTAATAAPPLLEFPTPTTAAATPPQNNTTQSGGYKDGTYTGPEVDAVYGLVQVQAVIQNGKISNVQFLEYPNDRRTSVRINSFAVPSLQQEAIQAQSANVNLITGATLTSEAFQMSLQSALNQAKGSL